MLLQESRLPALLLAQHTTPTCPSLLPPLSPCSSLGSLLLKMTVFLELDIYDALGSWAALPVWHPVEMVLLSLASACHSGSLDRVTGSVLGPVPDGPVHKKPIK